MSINRDYETKEQNKTTAVYTKCNTVLTSELNPSRHVLFVLYMHGSRSRVLPHSKSVSLGDVCVCVCVCLSVTNLPKHFFIYIDTRIIIVFFVLCFRLSVPFDFAVMLPAHS